MEAILSFKFFDVNSKFVVCFRACFVFLIIVLVYLVILRGFGVKTSNSTECFSVSVADVEKTKADFISKNPEVNEYLSEKFSCDRKKLFRELMNFVEKMPVDEVINGKDCKNKCWDACIEDYLVEFLKKDGGRMQCLNKFDFKKYLNGKEVVSVFRLLENEKADRLKNGEVQFDVGLSASFHAGPSRPCGVGLYVAGSEEVAKKAYWVSDELRQDKDLQHAIGEKSGKIVEMALDLKKVRVVELNKIKNLCYATLIENYAPVICEFKKACEFDHMQFGGDSVIHFLNELRSCVEEYGKIGFDYFGYDRKNRKSKFQENVKSVVYSLQKDDAQSNFDEEMKNFLSFCCDADKLISLFLAENFAFIARILGFDVVSFYEYDSVENDKSYVVVNPGVLTICSD